MVAKDLYAVLGLSSSASQAEVKRAYRKLARKFHPDVNPGNAEAESRFKEISAAFEVLGDSQKRKLYDEFGEDALRSGFDPEKARAYHEWQQRAQASGSFGTAAGGTRDIFGAGGFDLGDLFGDLTGVGRSEATDRHGGDIQAEMSIAFRDAILGTEREIQFVRPTPCEGCSGTGRVPTPGPEQCAQCAGTGRRSVAKGPVAFRATCLDCAGTGRKPGPVCSRCHGTGRVERSARLTVRLPAGIEDGQTIRLAGQGMAGVGGGAAGDLLIRVRVGPHPLLRRQGDDLYLDVPVTVREAMFGSTIEVPTLSGTIKLTVPAGVQSGTKLRAKGKGVPAAKARPSGDLYVVVRVYVPGASLDPETAKRAADEIEGLYGENVRSGLRL